MKTLLIRKLWQGGFVSSRTKVCSDQLGGGLVMVIYLDHAASSWPKPPRVGDAMVEAVQQYGANPGRGSHQLAVKASRVLFEARKNLAKLFHIQNPNHLFFMLNTTMALNVAIKGFLRDGDHVICTSVEHNSVRRPLEYLKRIGKVEVSYIEADERGTLNLRHLQQLIQSNTRLIVCTHSTNLLGTIIPIVDIAEIARENGVRLLVDAAQSAGTLPINVEKYGIDMLAFPGHKGLLGPQGTGGLYLAPDLELEPLVHGGTGSQSEEIEQPLVRPDRFESGTQNTPGVAGLNEGVKQVLQTSVETIQQREFRLTQMMMEGLLQIPGIRILGPELGEERGGVVSFTLQTVDAMKVAFELDRHYQIAVRAGYHCTPLSHICAGTMGTGAVRASVGFYTNKEEVDQFVEAVKEIEGRYRDHD